ncbi:MAG: DNA-formamidopyrimidine glycosylase [Geobacteraceae bacterium]|nr:DNA-formamidopyrimidine glycosylase [Geobacteraceae bacterium]
MPELPEVESVLQCLTTSTPSLIGRRVCSVRVLRDSVVDGNVRSVVNTLTGTVCNDVLRHGKYLFFEFQNSHSATQSWLALHLRMTGRLFLVPEQMAEDRHTRFVLLLDQGLALRFDDPRAFGRVWLVEDPREVTEKLGPDALLIQRESFLNRLHGLRRQLKQLLLDQSFVAGIGNIYADETLFRARLHPLKISSDLSNEEINRLYDALHGVIAQAVIAKGANIDGVFEAGSFPVAVYGRGGKRCLECGALVVKERFGQRGTHFCPVCQPL